MAFLAAVPVWVSVATAVASAGAGVYSAVQQRNAGIEQSNQIKAQARQEGNAATQREIDRRRDLMRALASQNASAGAAGIETGGSYGAGIRRNIRENQNDLLVDSAGSSARQSALASAARGAVTQGNASAATSLLDTAGKAYKSLGR